MQARAYGLIYFSSGGGTVPSTWWPHEFASHTDEVKKSLREILGKDAVLDDFPRQAWDRMNQERLLPEM